MVSLFLGYQLIKYCFSLRIINECALALISKDTNSYTNNTKRICLLITGATKNKVDDIWQKMWESGIANPLEVITTYLPYVYSFAR